MRVCCGCVLSFCAVQVSYLLNGLFARACKSLGSAAAQDSVDNILEEVRQLRGLLTAKLGQINGNLEGEARLVLLFVCLQAM